MQLPLTLEELVTAYDVARTTRLAQDKIAEELKHTETVLKNQLIEKLKEQELTVAGNAKVFFTLRTKERKQVIDWEAFYDYIEQNHAFDLLQRRVNEAAIDEREEAIPGVTSYEYDDLSRPQKVK